MRNKTDFHFFLIICKSSTVISNFWKRMVSFHKMKYFLYKYALRNMFDFGRKKLFSCYRINKNVLLSQQYFAQFNKRFIESSKIERNNKNMFDFCPITKVFVESTIVLRSRFEVQWNQYEESYFFINILHHYGGLHWFSIHISQTLWPRRLL